MHTWKVAAECSCVRYELLYVPAAKGSRKREGTCTESSEYLPQSASPEPVDHSAPALSPAPGRSGGSGLRCKVLGNLPYPRIQHPIGHCAVLDRRAAQPPLALIACLLQNPH